MLSKHDSVLVAICLYLNPDLMADLIAEYFQRHWGFWLLYFSIQNLPRGFMIRHIPCADRINTEVYLLIQVPPVVPFTQHGLDTHRLDHEQL